MGLGVAFDLGGLDHGLPAHACLCVFDRNQVAVAVSKREHQAFADILIVRYGDEVGADFHGRLAQPGPEVFRIVAIEQRKRQKFHRRLFALIHHDDTVQIRAVRGGGPFPADECRKPAGVVVPLGTVRDLLPHRGPDCISLEFCIWHAGVCGADQFGEKRLRVAGIGRRLASLRCCGISEQRVTVEHQRNDTHVFRMIGHNQEIERRMNPYLGAMVRMHDRISFCVPIRSIRRRRSITE